MSATATALWPVLVASKLHVPEVREGSVARAEFVARTYWPGARKLALLRRRLGPRPSS